MINNVASRMKVLSSIPSPGRATFSVEFAWVGGVMLNGNSKLSIDVNVNGCLSLYVSPATDWRPIESVPCLSPYGGGIGSNSTATLTRMSGREWMENSLSLNYSFKLSEVIPMLHINSRKGH